MSKVNLADESYMFSVEEVEKKLKTSTKHGLSEKEAEKRLAKYGKNVLPEKKRTHPIIRFLSHFNDVLIYVLLFAAVITVIKSEWVDTIVILLVIVINASIGFIQEGSAEKSLKNIQKMLSNNATVIREDVSLEIDASELVVGDLVVLRPGSKVPADLRLVETHNLLVEESMLTGESVSILKDVKVIDKEVVIGDRINLAFSGTNITSGTAVGIVVATGSQTEIGYINEMMNEVVTFRTPLLQQLDKLGKVILAFLLCMVVLLFAFGYFYRAMPISSLSMSLISLMVAMVPEGLPAIVSVILSIGVKKMYDANSIIRKLPTVETLGSMTVICSDKTGTLTMNEMTVKNIILADNDFDVTGESYEPEGEIIDHKTGKHAKISKASSLEVFLKTISLCNDSILKQDPEGHWGIIGSATDGAMKVLSEKSGIKTPNAERLDKIPFDSKYKYMSTYHSIGKEHFVFLTGAPDVLLKICKSQYDDGKAKKLNKKFWEEKIAEYAGRGLRMVAAAYKKEKMSELTHEAIEEGMIFVGIAGIIDPPRPEAIAAIKECQSADVRVKMITGDHKDTAKVIGSMLNIGNGKDAIVGSQLEHMDDDELVEVVQKYDIFARTSPEHKLRIVKALQERDEVVGMTGDGVNDAPALKQAEVGIAMGIKGTEVTKEAADMVITDDNFATIATAVKEGRRVYDNLVKTIWFLLPTNIAQGLLIVISILLGFAAPLSPLQILWINMATSTTLSFGIATELYEKNIMSRPPRDRNVPILNGFSIWRVLFVGALITIGAFYLEQNLSTKGYSQEFISTVLLQAIVFMQLAYMFNCRLKLGFSIDKNIFKNITLWISSAALVGLQMLIIYSPHMQSWFGTTSISAYYWYVSFILGAVVFVVVEIEKLIFSRILKKSF